MLERYLNRLYDTIATRGYIEVEQLVVTNRLSKRGTIMGQLRFLNGSQLDFGEVLVVQDRRIVKTRYRYHYQNASGELVFRYDNAPHYPQIETHPHHKHIGTEVLPAQAPDLNDVLREIEQLIFGAV
jgi:hypothetical protein